MMNFSPAEECIALLKAKNISVCAFDMDLTAVAAHSRGRLRRDHRLDEYLQKATPDFCALVPLLHEHKIGVAIATHSDDAELLTTTAATDGEAPLQEEEEAMTTIIIGTELAKALVDRHFNPEISSHCFIVAFNPRVRKVADEKDLIKRYHMRQIMEHFQVPPNEIVFFDDLLKTVQDCNEYCKVNAIQVDETVGFQFSDLLKNL